MPSTDPRIEEVGGARDRAALGIDPGSSAAEVAAPSAQRGDRPKADFPEARTDKLHKAHERLTQAVESIVSGEDWQRMLKVASNSTSTASTTSY